MAGYIERITGTIPHTNKSVDISLDGKNLIITGGNGSGKTSFLRSAYDKTVLLIIKKQQADLDGLQPIISKNIEFSSKFDDKKAVVLYFEDKRLASIVEARMAQGLRTTIQENKNTEHNQNLGYNLEQHLLNLKTRRSLAITEDNDKSLADKIDEWFTDFENRLKYLFEDESTRLTFDSNKNKFSIKQNDKPAYTFQTLSAGYKAIFDVYADLLMRTEYFEISPTELEGVVFIDEIDSHLHISLQRLILPFFADSFPNVQFIITTHSPFVLMSIKDTLVFDLANETLHSISQVKSQNKILNEYLGIPTTMPVWAEISLTDILNKYQSIEPNNISLSELKEELEKAGLEEYFPDSMAKILETK